MKTPRNKIIKPTIIFLIGILLIALSFTFWYFTIAPVCSLATYSFDRPTATNTTQTTATVYLGTVYFMQRDVHNRSRPVDYSFNVSFRVAVTIGGPIEVLVYVGDKSVWGPALTTKNVTYIECNSTKYYKYSDANRTDNLFRSVAANIPVSMIDAFTGGTTPYIVIRNHNDTSATTFSYNFYYKALYRSSNGVTLAIFLAGVIIAVVEGVVLVKFLIRRLRQR